MSPEPIYPPGLVTPGQPSPIATPKQIAATQRALRDKPEYDQEIPEVKLHPSITLDRVLSANERWKISLDNPGFCGACGADAEGCEPDAQNLECEICGEHEVYGANEILFHFI